MSLTRTEILKGKYFYPTNLVKLKTTKHFVDRLKERGIGINCIPTKVRVTENNIYCGDAEGNLIVSVVVRLNYSSSKFIFLCFNPIDGALKTVWFREKRKKDDNRRREICNKDSR